jgi:heat shock protein HslJ
MIPRAVRLPTFLFPPLVVLALLLSWRATALTEAPPTIGSLSPATFTGLLPCADCPGIRYQINLLPGGAYMLRRTYLRDGHDDSYYELGAWSLSGEGGTITLGGGREGNDYWAVVDTQTLRKLDKKGRPIDSKLPYDLTRAPAVEPIEPRLKLSGMFRYMADAARFRECRSGLEWPVAMSHDYLALERSYAARAEPGSDLLVSLRGRIEERMKMEGSGTEPTLVVEEFLSATPGKACEGPASAGLEHTRWRPIRIGDKPVIVSGQEREPWIHLDAGSARVTGSGGCNRFSGGYEAGKGTLRVGPLAATKMACGSMDTEDAFFRALDETRRYRVKGRVLELLDGNGKVLAELEERNLR